MGISDMPTEERVENHELQALMTKNIAVGKTENDHSIGEKRTYGEMTKWAHTGANDVGYGTKNGSKDDNVAVGDTVFK